MPIFGKLSMQRRATLHPDLQAIADESIKEFDFAIICGRRGYADQEAAFRANKSDLHYPHSKHNRTPSEAMDCALYPINWKDIERFEAMGAVFERVAARLLAEGTITHKIKWAPVIHGGKYRDYPHTELIDIEKGESHG